MVSMLNCATAAALVALCSVQVSGKKPSKPTKCNPETATASQCLKSSRYKYCDEDESIWKTATMESDMTCDENSMIEKSGLASRFPNGPAALALGVAVVIWQFV
ncbi:hypothetical protein IWW37_004573 [Coemansia sp. RSA 2050]|nr:hypothetical protein IWW37_004573 [Coemansia sp. RSA 2050]